MTALRRIKLPNFMLFCKVKHASLQDSARDAAAFVVTAFDALSLRACGLGGLNDGFGD